MSSVAQASRICLHIITVVTLAVAVALTAGGLFTPAWQTADLTLELGEFREHGLWEDCVRYTRIVAVGAKTWWCFYKPFFNQPITNNYYQAYANPPANYYPYQANGMYPYGQPNYAYPQGGYGGYGYPLQPGVNQQGAFYGTLAEQQEAMTLQQQMKFQQPMETWRLTTLILVALFVVFGAIGILFGCIGTCLKCPAIAFAVLTGLASAAGIIVFTTNTSYPAHYDGQNRITPVVTINVAQSEHRKAYRRCLTRPLVLAFDSMIKSFGFRDTCSKMSGFQNGHVTAEIEIHKLRLGKSFYLSLAGICIAVLACILSVACAVLINMKDESRRSQRYRKKHRNREEKEIVYETPKQLHYFYESQKPNLSISSEWRGSPIQSGV